MSKPVIPIKVVIPLQVVILNLIQDPAFTEAFNEEIPGQAWNDDSSVRNHAGATPQANDVASLMIPDIPASSRSYEIRLGNPEIGPVLMLGDFRHLRIPPDIRLQ